MADDFANELVHQAVARLCLHKGVKAAEHRASQALADFTKLYIETLGRHMHRYAERAGRSECDVQDLMNAFEYDMGAVGATSVPELTRAAIRFAEMSREDDDDEDDDDDAPRRGPLSADYNIPEFPVERPAMKAMAAGPAGAVAGAAAHSRPAYVPSFMPAFPEAYTYKYTEVEAASRAGDRRTQHAEHMRQAKAALAHLKAEQQTT